jgi:uncharacterized protein (TIGR02996 family)
MGLFDWLRRKAPTPTVANGDNNTTRFLREKIAECVAAGDLLALAITAAALDGNGAMVFGMVVASGFDGRDEVRDEAVAALRAMLPTASSEQCVAVFDAVARPRPAIADSWRALVDDVARHARAAIDRDGAATLLQPCVALRRPARIADAFAGLRDQLFTHALDRLRALVPTLDGDGGRKILSDIRRQSLVDVRARFAELAEDHRVRVETAIATTSGEPRNAALEAALDAGDPAAFHVLADWLSEHDHPRGELIALQLRAEADATLEPDVADHVDDHAGELLGELADHARSAFVWKRGFIDSALLSVDEDTDRSPHSVEDLIKLLLSHGSARRLRELRLGINGTVDAGLDELVELVASYRPGLRRLVLGELDREQTELSSFIVGNIAGAWSLPELRELVVCGSGIDLGTLAHDKLERLEVEGAGLSDVCARAIAAARLPSLRHLDLCIGDDSDGGTAEIEDVEPLLARRDLASLVHIGIKDSVINDAVCTLLPSSPLAARLASLDLSRSALSGVGARALIVHKAAFPKLESIDVSATHLDDAHVAELRAAFPTIVANDLRG